MPTHHAQPSRRAILKGLGVSMALPWLESLHADEPAAGQKGKQTPPRRLGVVFMGNGVNTAHWGRKPSKSKAPNQALQLNTSLTPLEAFKDQLLIFEGLHNQTAAKAKGGHYGSMNVLSGAAVQRSTTADIGLSTTMDQLIAQRIGHLTPLPSLVIGTEGPRIGTDDGYSKLYASCISWSSKHHPVPKEIYPRLAFDRLFSDGANRQQDKSILDAVLGEATSTHKKLSRHDQRKFDEYLAAVRELETRIERSEQLGQQERSWHPSIDTPWMERPGPQIPRDLDTHYRMMLDIMVMAFQMDKTRVITHMMNNDLSSANFSFLGGIKGGQHELSHHAGNKTKLAMYQKVNQYHMQLLADALQKMADTQEGETSLLDNSMILFLSSLNDGNAHDRSRLPVLLLGGKACGIKGGRFLDYSKSKNRKLCRLHIALMERMGLQLETFGDAESSLLNDLI